MLVSWLHIYFQFTETLFDKIGDVFCWLMSKSYSSIVLARRTTLVLIEI